MDTKIKLRVKGVTKTQFIPGAYTVMLEEVDGERRLPITIGIAEAQAIAICLEHLTVPRPLTHDLFKSFAEAFSIQLREVFISKFHNGIFYAELLLEDGHRLIRLDSRSSDAIAIALRFHCEIYTTEELMDTCAILMQDSYLTSDISDEDMRLLNKEPEDITDEAELKRWLSLLDEDELDERLQESVDEENYEYANMYKEELLRRSEEEEDASE